MVAVVAIAGGQARGVGSGVGLCEHEAADGLARGELGEELGLLLIGAKGHDGPAAHRVGHRHPDRHRGVDPGQLLDRNQVGQQIHRGAAELLGHHHAEQPEPAHLGEDLVRELTGAVALGRAGANPFLGEGAHHFQNHLLLFVEREIHWAPPSRSAKAYTNSPALLTSCLLRPAMHGTQLGFLTSGCSSPR